MESFIVHVQSLPSNTFGTHFQRFSTLFEIKTSKLETALVEIVFILKKKNVRLTTTKSVDLLIYV